MRNDVHNYVRNNRLFLRSYSSSNCNCTITNINNVDYFCTLPYVMKGDSTLVRLPDLSRMGHILYMYITKAIKP